jgi:RimJ/RimL family protein N-acetyltransferase
MRYKCLPVNRFDYQAYAVVPYREEDKFLIMQWRNEQMDVLRQNRPLTEADQERYYHEVVVPSFSADRPRIILFSYLRYESCIGYGGLTNIDWDSRRAEISFLVNTDRTRDHAVYKEDFAAFLHLMKQAAFGTLQFNRLFTETFDIRPHHIRILEENGFRLEGRMRQHVIIQGQPVDSLIHGCLKEYCDVER